MAYQFIAKAILGLGLLAFTVAGIILAWHIAWPIIAFVFAIIVILNV